MVACAQWFCLAWTLDLAFELRLPAWVHIASVASVYLFNRRLSGLPVPRPGGPALRARRVYTAAVFISLFAALAALVVGLAWTVAAVVVSLTGLMPGLVTSPLSSTAGRWTVTAAMLVVTVALVYGYVLGQRRFKLTRLEVGLADLPNSLDGLKLVQISDLHLGPFMSASKASGYVEFINSLKPDLVCITGDIADGLGYADEALPVLGRIRARHGVFAILGNHDHYVGADEVAAAVARHTNFTLLRDRVATVGFQGVGAAGRGLHIVGLEDRGRDWARGLDHDPELARLVEAVPEGEPMVVLCHRPDNFDQAARLGADLVLCGHTHGGQLALPWPRLRPLGLARFMTAYPRGTYRSGASVLHVNTGLGVTGQQVRLSTPREITLITLQGGS